MFLGNFKNIFASKTLVLCLQNMFRRGVKRKNLGNTEETQTTNISRMFPQICLCNNISSFLPALALHILYCIKQKS